MVTAKKKEIVNYKDVRIGAYLNLLEIEPGFNPRTLRNMKPDDELIASVKENGVLSPIHVRRKKGQKKLLVVDGHRRFLAAQEAKTKDIPVIDHGFLTNKEALLLALKVTDNHKPFTKRELIDACQRLKGYKMTLPQMAKALGKSKSVVSTYLAVTKASPRLRSAAKKSTKEGGVSAQAAAQASTLPRREQDELASKLKGKSTKEAVKIVKEKKNKNRPTVSRTRTSSPASRKPGNAPSILTPGEKKPAPEYRVASDYRERCQRMEKEVRKRIRRNPSNKELLGMQKMIEVIKGKMTVEQAFVKWDRV